MTMNVKTLKNVITESIGIITDNTQVKNFTSFTRNGTLEAEIENFGDLKTDYVVTVSE